MSANAQLNPIGPVNPIICKIPFGIPQGIRYTADTKDIVTLSIDVPFSRSMAQASPSVAPFNGGMRTRCIVAGLFVIAGIVATRGAWEDILHIALRDEESSHVWLVPFLAGWLAWIRRKELSAVEPATSLWGPVLVAAGWAVSHWGFYGARQSPWHFGALLVAVGCLMTILGSRLLMVIWPAILVLIFIIPVPGMIRQQISIPLERATASVTTTLLGLTGAPVARSGNQILINGYPVTVAEACNGLRMIFPLVLIVYVFCFTLPLRAGARWVLLLTSPLCAIACNVIRLLPTVVLFGYASKNVADKFHDYSGWPMVSIAFLVLMGLVKVMQALNLPVMKKSATEI